MKRFFHLELALFLLAIWAIPVDTYAIGTLTLRLQSSGGTSKEIQDNAPGDSSTDVGVVTYNGQLDIFSTVVVTVISKPVLGDPGHANMTLTVLSTTSGSGGTLVASASDTGFPSGSGKGPLISAIGGTTSGQTFFQSFLDAYNRPFYTAGCTGGERGPFTGAFDDTVTTECDLNGVFSLTMVTRSVQGANSVQSSAAEIKITTPSEEIGCRFTGGGVDTDGNWNHVLENGQTVRNGAGNLPAGIDRYQFGGQVGARTGEDDQPSGEWEHHQQTGPSGSFSFHVGSASAPKETRIVDVRCSDPGFCFPARPAPCKQLDFDGIGSFQNLGNGQSKAKFMVAKPNVIQEPSGNKNTPFTLHWVKVNIDDLGEPGRLNSGQPGSVECPGRGFGELSPGPYVPDPVGNPGNTIILPYTPLANCICPDFYRITIYRGVLASDAAYLSDGRVDPASLNQTDVIYESFGYIDGGNLQIHPPTGFDLK